MLRWVRMKRSVLRTSKKGVWEEIGGGYGWIAFESDSKCVMFFLGCKPRRMRRRVFVLRIRVGARNLLIGIF